MIRLTSQLWVQSYLTRLRLKEIPAFVTLKGDLTAGSIFIKINTLDGYAKAFHKSFDVGHSIRSWIILCEGYETHVDEKLEQEKTYDPDIWIIEVEDKQGRSLLDEPGLKD
jgi:hypothetical protein|tara:strand:+ start:982 stop:1314 length:333 start_codon:yes stop_codon:yes gene_type:complete